MQSGQLEMSFRVGSFPSSVPAEAAFSTFQDDLIHFVSNVNANAQLSGNPLGFTGVALTKDAVIETPASFLPPPAAPSLAPPAAPVQVSAISASPEADPDTSSRIDLPGELPAKCIICINPFMPHPPPFPLTHTRLSSEAPEPAKSGICKLLATFSSPEEAAIHTRHSHVYLPMRIRQARSAADWHVSKVMSIISVHHSIVSMCPLQPTAHHQRLQKETCLSSAVGGIIGIVIGGAIILALMVTSCSMCCWMFILPGRKRCQRQPTEADAAGGVAARGASSVSRSATHPSASERSAAAATATASATIAGLHNRNEKPSSHTKAQEPKEVSDSEWMLRTGTGPVSGSETAETSPLK